MISIITASTVTTVTTVALGGSVALIGIIVLLSLLVQKELANSAVNWRLQKLSRALNIGIFPLVIAFILIVATRLVNALR